MKLMTQLLTAVVLFASTAVDAQINTPKPSPGASVTQTVGLVDITVVYSRPGMKDRAIFGELVPFDKIWRTGANKATMIAFEEPVQFAGKEVPAGKYSMFSIPGKQEWTIIINKNTELWGAGDYKEEEDVARIKVKSMKVDATYESFTIDFSNFSSTGAHLNLMWENTMVAIPLTVDTESKVMAQIKAQLIDVTPGDDVKDGTYMAAGRYYADNGKDQKQALAWMEKAIEMKPEAFWYSHYKAQLQADMGDKKVALKTAMASLELAKKSERGDFGYIARNEKLIAKLKG